MTKSPKFIPLVLLIVLASFVLSFDIALAIQTPDIQVEFGGFSKDQFNTAVGWQEATCDGKACLKIGWIGQYISAIYKYGIGLAAVLAAIMIMVGGFLWLTSAGSPDRVSKAREFITSALTGLVLALFSFLILYTVNPELVKLDMIEVLTPAKVPLPEVIETGAEIENDGDDNGQPYLTEAEARAELARLGIRTKNPCPPGQTTGCVNTAGMPRYVIAGLGELNENYGPIFLSGGTEGGHITHGLDKPVADIRQNPLLNQYVRNNKIDSYEVSGYGTRYVMEDGTTFLDEGDHWHVEFPEPN